MRCVVVRSSIQLLAIWSLVAATGLAAEKPDAVQVPPQLRQAVSHLEGFHRWQLHRVDQEPTVAVEGSRGYRIVMRTTWKEPGPGTQIPQVASAIRDDSTWVTRHTDWHFVLVPAKGVKFSDQAKREILWNMPDEKEFRLPVALGERDGFAWFTCTTIPIQSAIRDHLKLTGGDDRLTLAIRGLSVEDEHQMTRNSVIRMFATFGDQGFAALEKVIQNGVEPSQSAAIRALADFPEAKATALLTELYRSGDPRIRNAAAYVLIHEPFRAEAKQAYFDMVRRQLHVNEAMRACLKFGWKEAAPLIVDVLEQPTSLGAFRDAYRISRELSGRPIDPDILAAAELLHPTGRTVRTTAPTEEERAAALRSIVRSADTEGAACIGITLATFIAKGNTKRVNQEGLEILKGLPHPVVSRMLNYLKQGLEHQDNSEWSRLQPLFQEVL